MCAHTVVTPNYESLAEEIEDAGRPWLDRRHVDEAALDDECRHWRENGYLVLPGALPHDLIDRYSDRFERYHCLAGFQTPTPYEHVAELRDLALYPPVIDRINKLIGDEMVLHLNLTGWISSERNWHQDDYLNSPEINGWYLAIWMALDDVSPDSGPFQFIPGSHRWPVLRRDRVQALMTPEQAAMDAADLNAAWTLFTQDHVAAVVEQRRQEMGMPYESFLAKKGDVLIWHACLHHRGSQPTAPVPLWRRRLARRFGHEVTVPPRKALISHFTAHSRIQVPDESLVYHPGGGCYALFGLHLNHYQGGAETLRHWARKRAQWALRHLRHWARKRAQWALRHRG
jgi:Phytanoyl-CoA dioxygenase (PhyH)